MKMVVKKEDRRLYGILVKCSKECEHLVSVGKTWQDAWANAEVEYGMMDSARQVRVSKNHHAVKALLAKAAKFQHHVRGVEA